MRIAFLFTITLLFIGCQKENPTPNAPSTQPISGANNQEYLGLIEFDLEYESGVITHFEYHIDSVKQGTILVPDGQGGYENTMFHVGSNVRSVGFRYFDSNGDENVLSLTQTINGTTNSVSISHLGDNPYVAQTNTNIPLCNTADFVINVISENEATFEADHLYNFYTQETVNVTNGSYIMY